MAFLFKHGQQADSHGVIHPTPPTVQAPEVDPSFGASAVLVLVLALLVIRGRRRAP
jgi:hypothetical protein